MVRSSLAWIYDEKEYQQKKKPNKKKKEMKKKTLSLKTIIKIKQEQPKRGVFLGQISLEWIYDRKGYQKTEQNKKTNKKTTKKNTPLFTDNRKIQASVVQRRGVSWLYVHLCGNKMGKGTKQNKQQQQMNKKENKQKKEKKKGKNSL